MGRIRVRLDLPELRPEDRDCVVRVVVRDTTQADALHPTVAELADRVELDPGGVELSLDLPQDLDPRHRYSVWAHLDHDGSGEIASGDLITTENVAVDPQGGPDEPIDVPLTRV